MPTRRHILASLAALSSVGVLPAYAGVVDLDWKDLVPEGDTGKLLKTSSFR